MALSEKQKAQLLEAVQVAINNSREIEELKVRIAIYGFNDERINEGETLYNSADKILREHKIVKAEQHKQTKIVNQKIKELVRYYMKYAKLVRRRLRKEKAFLEILGLSGGLKETFPLQLIQIKQFFENIVANTEIFTLVQNFNVTQEVVDEGNRLIAEAEKANDKQEELKGRAQDLTVQRENVFSQLSEWYGDFKQAAINGCEDRPQLLEQLKIRAYSEGYLKWRRKQSSTTEPEPAQEPAAPEEPAAASESQAQGETTNQ